VAQNFPLEMCDYVPLFSQRKNTKEGKAEEGKRRAGEREKGGKGENRGGGRREMRIKRKEKFTQ
jgi:hypothetical protein